MRLSESGKKLIYDFEGLHRSIGDGKYAAYRCPAGVWTIYAGLTEGVTPGMVVTTEQGEQMFAKEIERFERAVLRAVTVEINQNEFDACVSLAYNIGAAGFRRSSVLRHLNAGNRAQAAKSFELWVNGGGKFLPGLLIRRKREAALFLTPMPAPEPEPEMPQAVTERAPVTEAAQQSRTVTGALVAGVGTVTAYADDAMQTLMETAAQVSAWSPVQNLLTTAGVHVKGIGFSLAVGGLALVVGRRFNAAARGKTG